MRELITNLITFVIMVIMAMAALVISNEIIYAEPQSMFYINKHYCP